MNVKNKAANAMVLILSIMVLSAIALFAFFMLDSGVPEQAQIQLDSAYEEAVQVYTIHIANRAVLPNQTNTVITYNDEEYTKASNTDQQFAEINCTSYSEDTISFDLVPENMNVTVKDGETIVFEGDAQSFNSAFKPEPISHYSVFASAQFQTESGATTAEYSFALNYHIEPKLSLSAETLSQGDVLLFCAENVPQDAQISLELPFAYTPVMQKSEYGMFSYIPLNYMRTEGEYTAVAAYNGETYELKFNVTEPAYEVQHLTVSSSTESSTIGDNSAVTTYNEVMDTLSAVYDEQIYWTENFIMPCDGSITTEFGIKRYVNNATTPSRHAGIDIACAEGTPVKASNSGRVIFADYLQVSGNTVVIEHGMGVHTLYLHMNSLSVNEGDIVNLGDEIGTVGMTGFATGPHLHFQVNIGPMTVSPWYLFDGTSGIYKIRNYIQ